MRKQDVDESAVVRDYFSSLTEEQEYDEVACTTCGSLFRGTE